MLYLVLSIVALALAADSEIVKWNKILLNRIVADSVNPPTATRQLALLHVAQFEAINAITQDCEPFLQGDAEVLQPEAEALPEPSAAQAAHDILAALYPATSFSAELDASLALYTGLVLSQSVDLGSAVAQAVLLFRSGDGSTTANLGYTAPMPLNDFDWRPTAPAFKPYLLPNWGLVEPWVMPAVDTFALTVLDPPFIGEPAYDAEITEVQALGSASSVLRTVEQTEIARTFEAGPGTVTPPGQWFQIAAQLSASHELDLVQESRLFLLLAVGEADAAITVWSVKKTFTGWRPITAIQVSGLDGAWTPLLVTPPFPGYISGHSTFSAVGATILSLFFGSDEQPSFTVTSGVYSRDFTSLSAAAEEAGRSRVYGGIHFQADSSAGNTVGSALANFVFTSCAQPSFAAVITPPPPPTTDETLTIPTNSSEPTEEEEDECHEHEEREEAYLIVILVLVCLIFILVLAILIWLVRPRGEQKTVNSSYIGNPPFAYVKQKDGRTTAMAHSHSYGGWGGSHRSWLIAGGFCVFMFVFLFVPVAFWLLFGGHHHHWI